MGGRGQRENYGFEYKTRYSLSRDRLHSFFKKCITLNGELKLFSMLMDSRCCQLRYVFNSSFCTCHVTHAFCPKFTNCRYSVLDAVWAKATVMVRRYRREWRSRWSFLDMKPYNMLMDLRWVQMIVLMIHSSSPLVWADALDRHWWMKWE